MTSDLEPTEAYVWIWLPGEVEPVVAGRIEQDGDQVLFAYGASYRERADAIPIYEPELPLQAGTTSPLPGMSMPSCLRDGSPDAWGRRVIMNHLSTAKRTGGVSDFSDMTYLLHSGSDRIGALDFQASPTEYAPRLPVEASIEELLAAAESVVRGIPLTPALDKVLKNATSIGGARPKALIDRDDRKHVAKFSSSTDTHSVVKAEFLAMTLAAKSGLDVAPVSLVQAAGKDVLLIERFDREKVDAGWARRPMVSALTMLGLDEMLARYASYEDLAELIRHRFTAPNETLAELFGRICMNVLCSNTDDHARNHAAFWNGSDLTLTPAYDICPQNRTGRQASQAMLICGEDRDSTLATCLRAAPVFHLRERQALSIIENQISTIADQWDTACTAASLDPVDRSFLAGRQFLNPYSLEGLGAEHKDLVAQFHDARARIVN